MRNRADVHNYERKLKHALAGLKASAISQESKRNIIRYLDARTADGLSLARKIKYVSFLRNIAILLRKPFSQTTKDDVLRLVQKIECKNYSDSTKLDYKMMLKRFYKWLRGGDEYPTEVKWIKSNQKNKNHVLPEELLIEEEVERLAEATTNPRDRAFILTLYESGCRVGEILTLRIKHVHFDEYGAQLMVSGKTRDRRVRIIASAPKLAVWLDNHPLRNDPEAPLWISLGTRERNTQLSYPAVRAVLKDAAKKAGIKKRICPYLLRHSRATALANFLTEAQMKQYFGWVQGSDMASTYVHLSGRDIDNALLRLHGIKEDETRKEERFKVIVCPRCGVKNSPSSKFCNGCGLPLNVKTTVQLDETRAKVERLMNALVKNPKVLDALLEGVEKLKIEKLE